MYVYYYIVKSWERYKWALAVKVLTLAKPNYFCLNHEDQRVFQFEIIITEIGNILIVSARGPSLYIRIWRLHSQIMRIKTVHMLIWRRQIMTYKDGHALKMLIISPSGRLIPDTRDSKCHALMTHPE